MCSHRLEPTFGDGLVAMVMVVILKWVVFIRFPSGFGSLHSDFTQMMEARWEARVWARCWLAAGAGAGAGAGGPWRAALRGAGWPGGPGGAGRPGASESP